MSEQEVTYSTVRFHKSSGSQNQVKIEETQGPREAGHRVPWQLIVIVLGILCSLLLVTVALLVINNFQYSQGKHELKEALNCHHNYSTMQNDIDLKEEMTRNMSVKCSAYNDILEFLKREQNRGYSGIKNVSGFPEYKGKRVKMQWFCYGIKCYYFIMDKKVWSGCNQTCHHLSLSLLTIDDEDELKFLQQQVTPDSYWIGLSYDKEKQEWSWIDKGPSKLDLNIKKFNLNDGGCTFLSKTRVENTNCDKSYSCICGKRLHKFPV
ncbi:killer cell lectin-like receptor 5 isoform X2 [Arvicanthis niloticus]|uniref:killer cell lectin-like receptor 5 isoform X2 n=1 Tax=Arvicanthis niloticus TaxID=61156 RepID=UPI00402BDF6C